MALQANAVLDVADVFNYMKLTTPPSNDPNYILIESMINRVSDFCESYTGGPIINKTLTVALDGNGLNDITLPYYPVQSITSATMDGVTITTNVDFYPEGIVFLKDGSLFNVGRKNVSLTYVAGYGTDKNTIPQDIKQAALLIVHYWYKRDTLDYSQTFGESEVILKQWRFPTSALNLLDRYRRVNIGVI